MSSEPLPLPPFYDPVQAEQFRYSPNASNLFALAQGWRKEYRLAPASQDARNLHLLLIDAQRDFCFPEGSLYVGGRSGRGAIDDSRRTAEFIYRNLGRLTNITTTLDSHFAFQIFFPSFWVGADGEPLTAHRTVSVAQIDAGAARPNPEVANWLCGGDLKGLQEQVRDYCARLEREGKYTLYLWPPHCLLGSEGHALAGVIQAAQLFHAYARGVQAWVEAKGENPLTENYSVLGPEVRTRADGSRLADRNDPLLETLLRADALLIAGQAASHCVKSTVDDLLAEIQVRDRSLARRVYLLTDCMSSVAVPDGQGGFVADFTPQAREALHRYATAGMHLVESTTPLAEWPGLGG